LYRDSCLISIGSDWQLISFQRFSLFQCQWSRIGSCLNIELNRADAKGAIIKRDTDDPDLDAVLSSAHNLQLQLAKEQNRHTEAMRGFVARTFGHGDNVPTYIAAVALGAGLLIGAGRLIVAARSEQQPLIDFWAKQAERAFTFSGTCLAFIFGKGMSNRS
jgi:hypothetical protein